MSQQIYSLSRLTASVSPRCIFNLLFDGSRASGGARTHDLRFTKPLLCQLSYTGGDAKTCKYTETRIARNTKKATISRNFKAAPRASAPALIPAPREYSRELPAKSPTKPQGPASSPNTAEPNGACAATKSTFQSNDLRLNWPSTSRFFRTSGSININADRRFTHFYDLAS